MATKSASSRPGRRSAEHLATLAANFQEVTNLLKIHTTVAGDSSGRKYGVEVLNKSGIVLLVACWEAYIEDLAESAFSYMLERVKTPDDIPGKIKAIVSRRLRDSSDDRALWKLAGDGWRSILERHKDDTLRRHTRPFNTPRAEQINQLFQNLVGVRNVSTSWRWPGQSSQNACEKLDKLIKLRGAVAHRVATSSAVHKKDVRSSMTFVTRLAVATHNVINEHLKTVTSRRPWGIYKVDVRR